MLLPNFSTFILETGTDEAGRGCLAGPVTAAAVILPPDFENIILNDSKQLSEKTREKLRPIIEEYAVSFAVTHLHPKEIDEINILNASMKGMQECILKLNPNSRIYYRGWQSSIECQIGFKNHFWKTIYKRRNRIIKINPESKHHKRRFEIFEYCRRFRFSKNLS